MYKLHRNTKVHLDLYLNSPINPLQYQKQPAFLSEQLFAVDRCVMVFNFIQFQTSQNTSSFLIYLEMSAIDAGKVDFHLRTQWAKEKALTCDKYELYPLYWMNNIQCLLSSYSFAVI